MQFSINDFWVQRFGGVAKQSQAMPLDGWVFESSSDDSYVEAALNIRNGFDDLDQKVWLVAAPGAVGKSTFAREVCAATGAVYLDLSVASTVAGNYVVGGLVYTNLLSSWTGGQAALVIDALDEARLRVTQSGFEAFLKDVASAAERGKFPVIVLGRVGIVEEAWTILNELAAISPPIFEIELFDHAQANRFVMARLQNLAQNDKFPELKNSLQTHSSVYAQVISQIIGRIKDLSEQDGDRFVGYAPVLDAVSKVIASETNPARIGMEMLNVLEGQVLTSLATEILRREQSKLVNQLANTFPQVPVHLYEPEEQLERLGSRLFKTKSIPLPAQLLQHQVAIYEQAVSNLLPQHPFLDGTGQSPSSAVFAACIVAAALKGKNPDLIAAAERYASSAHHTSNPFLYEFYTGTTQSNHSVPTEHIGLVFESVLARAKPGESVRLSVDGDDDSENLAVEIVVTSANLPDRRTELSSPKSGTLRFGRSVAGVSIDAEGATVELGVGDQIELVAPVFIAAKAITLHGNQIVVKGDNDVIENTVILEASALVADPGLSAPIVRAGAVMQVSWPDAVSYPWTQFTAPFVDSENPQTTAALRILRRLVMAFRSHSKGELARFKDKIEHQRMLKGEVGVALLQKLLSDGVIHLRSPMYVLNADVLGAKVGASFLDVKLKRYSTQTRNYVQSLN